MTVEPPAWIRPGTTRRPPVRPPVVTNQPWIETNGGFDSSDLECGIPDYRAPATTGLIVGGEDAARGQFPW